MKKIQLLAVCGLIFALGGVARADFVKPAAVTVVSVQGEARYSVDGQTWHPLVVGKILHSGAVIETAAGSSADLVFSGSPVPIPENTSAPQSMAMLSQAPDPNVRGYAADRPLVQQNVIRMTSDTMLAVDKLTTIDTGADTVSDTELDLRAGKIFANVKKMSASSQFIIKLPNGVAGIRGSSGCISADGTTQWYRGLIVLSFVGSNGTPHVIVLHAGFEYDPQTGEILQLPPRVLAALREFGVDTQTIYAEVTSIVKDLTVVYISPTAGTKASQ